MYFGKWLRMVDDLSEPHETEYSIAFQEQSQAEKCALYLLQEEQKITLFVDEESDVSEWDYYHLCVYGNLSIQDTLSTSNNGLLKLQNSLVVNMTAGLYGLCL